MRSERTRRIATIWLWLTLPTAALLSWMAGKSPLAAPEVVAAAGPPILVSRECAQIYRQGFIPVTSRTAAKPTQAGRPGKNRILVDPDYGTCIVRATDHAAESPRDFARNDYSRRQAFNADNTRFLVYARGGAWHLYDAETLVHLKKLAAPRGEAEPQWHPTRANMLYFLPDKGGLTLHQTNVQDDSSQVVADFSGMLPWPDATRIWTRSEGSPSADGRYWCFLAQTSKHETRGVFTYDLQTRKIVGSRALRSSPDSVSMSPSGRYCIVAAKAPGGGTVAWSRDFSKARTLNSGSEHSDLAIGADGSDVYVFVNHGGNGYLTMVDVETGQPTSLVPAWIEGTVTSLHVSGRALDRPGWVVVSTYNHSGREKWLHERVLAVELKADPRVVGLARHHTRLNGYWTQPQASVSRDFSRVLFNSNWGAASALDVDAYLIRLPDDMFARIPPR